jgi:hypothetical protein
MADPIDDDHFVPEVPRAEMRCPNCADGMVHDGNALQLAVSLRRDVGCGRGAEITQ